MAIYNNNNKSQQKQVITAAKTTIQHTYNKTIPYTYSTTTMSTTQTRITRNKSKTKPMYKHVHGLVHRYQDVYLICMQHDAGPTAVIKNCVESNFSAAVKDTKRIFRALIKHLDCQT